MLIWLRNARFQRLIFIKEYQTLNFFFFFLIWHSFFRKIWNSHLFAHACSWLTRLFKFKGRDLVTEHMSKFKGWNRNEPFFMYSERKYHCFTNAEIVNISHSPSFRFDEFFSLAQIAPHFVTVIAELLRFRNRRARFLHVNLRFMLRLTDISIYSFSQVSPFRKTGYPWWLHFNSLSYVPAFIRLKVDWLLRHSCPSFFMESSHLFHGKFSFQKLS